jgi:hypothetical protein
VALISDLNQNERIYIAALRRTDPCLSHEFLLDILLDCSGCILFRSPYDFANLE